RPVRGGSVVSEANDARGRGRPRDPKVDEAILGATVAVLRERGWSGTTIEEVAARAGVGKTSIYRRYPAKVALVADAATRDREIQPGTDPEHVLDMVDGPLLFRLMVTKAPLDYGFADQLVDRVMRAMGR